MVSTGIRPGAGDGRKSPLLRKTGRRVVPPSMAGFVTLLQALTVVLLLLAIFAVAAD